MYLLQNRKVKWKKCIHIQIPNQKLFIKNFKFKTKIQNHNILTYNEKKYTYTIISFWFPFRQKGLIIKTIELSNPLTNIKITFISFFINRKPIFLNSLRLYFFVGFPYLMLREVSGDPCTLCVHNAVKFKGKDARPVWRRSTVTK